MVAPERSEEQKMVNDDLNLAAGGADGKSTPNNDDTQEFACTICEFPDSAVNLLLCKLCRKWTHYTCADISPDTPAALQFTCNDCTSQQKRIDEAVNSQLSQRLAIFETALSSKLNSELADIKSMMKMLMAQQPVGTQSVGTQPVGTQSGAASGPTKEEANRAPASFVTLRKNTGTLPKQPIINATPLSHDNNNNDSRSHSVPTVGTQQPSNGLDGYRPINGSRSFETSHERQHEASIAGLSQLIIRQSIQELPEFHGDSRQWPRFKAIYTQTNEVGNFSNIDNLTRLDRALKGRARATVEALLFDPRNVNEVMNQLEEHHGQPDNVINELMQDLHKLKPPKDGGPRSLIPFSQKLNSLVANIIALRKFAYLNNPMEVRTLVSKLSLGLQIKWTEHRLGQSREADLSQLNDWLVYQARIIAQLPTTSRSDNPTQYSRERVNVHNDEVRVARSNERERNVKCNCCHKYNHKTIDCRIFQDMNVNKRWKVVKDNKICLSCLNSTQHSSKDCPHSKICGKNKCTYRHHELLHTDPKSNDDNKSESINEHTEEDILEEDVPEEDIMVHVTTRTEANRRTLFKIIPVTLYGAGTKIETYAFLDDGSSATIVDDSIAKKLNLNGKTDPLCVRYSNGEHGVDKRSIRTKLKIAGVGVGNVYNISNVRTFKNLRLPKQSQNSKSLRDKYPHLANIPLQDLCDVAPKILIGVEHADLLVPEEVRSGKPGDPVALYTKLGWAIMGKTTMSGGDEYAFTMTVCECSRSENIESIDNQLREYFSIESLGIKPIDDVDSIENQRANRIIKQTMRNIGPRYEIGLFWKEDNVNLVNSYSMALKRLEGIEHKMRKDVDFGKWYRDTIADYLHKGYLRKATEIDLKVTTGKVWYLPHFCVTNNNKQPPKRRLVFDAAAKVGKMSLNSQLISGPDATVSMLGVLFKFRQGQIGVMADIKEMFSQIKMLDGDQQSQRILWRDGEKNRKPDVYIMQVMTFGSTCSPSSAQAVKNHNAELFKEKFPIAATAIQTQMYVDDYLNSHPTTAEAIEVAQEVIEINKAAGFTLRNFLSNDPEVLKSLSPSAVKEGIIDIEFSDSVITEKVLGLRWNITTDEFVFQISTSALKVPESRPPTKREVLRSVMKIYDILGFISHYTIRGKILMQEIWKEGVKWDSQIPPSLNEIWQRWVQDLPQLSTIRIPRCYFKDYDSTTEVELHTFVDASLNSYAAVTYFRFKHQGQIHVALVSSKAKVAPTKSISIPRLELLAALVGARLTDTITNEHTVKFNKRILWSDSRVVLSWIRSTTKKFKQFVAVRKSEIHELTSINCWHHVPSSQNVADIATKWNLRNVNESTWYKGPEFLWRNESEWPKELIEKDNDIPENASVEELNLHYEDDYLDIVDVARFSNWRRLVRTIAYVKRFLKAITRSSSAVPFLTATELQEAELLLIRKIQIESFPIEVAALENNEEIETNSSIVQLSPVMCDDKVIRLGSRLQNSSLPFEARNPVILPNRHPITRLIVKYFHDKYLHIGQESVLAALRQKYWVIDARSALKSVKSKCQYCKNKSAKIIAPLMGQLPSCRVVPPGKPFLHSGVDIFGPLWVTVKRQHEKRYGVLFTCMATRAIHIELASDLSVDSFLVCLRNFLFRRGWCSDMWSDNGTNLVGANNEMIAEWKKMQLSIGSRVAEMDMNWHFNPPSAPHFGGAWERLIRCVKGCLAVLLKSTFPREDTLRSALIEAEFIVNSRPLTHIPINSEDDDPLTPNHFLIGCSGNVPDLFRFNQNDQSERKQWKLASQLSNAFWKKWTREYLPEIARRSKWYSPVEPIKVGDVGVIVDEGALRNTWKKAKVIATYPGSDGVVRTLLLKTATSELKRPVVKFAKLDVV